MENIEISQKRNDFINKKIDFLLKNTTILQCVYLYSKIEKEHLAYFLVFDVDLGEFCPMFKKLSESENFIKTTDFPYLYEKADFVLQMLNGIQSYCVKALEHPDTKEEVEYLNIALENISIMKIKLQEIIDEKKVGIIK